MAVTDQVAKLPSHSFAPKLQRCWRQEFQGPGTLVSNCPHLNGMVLQSVPSCLHLFAEQGTGDLPTLTFLLHLILSRIHSQNVDHL